MENEIKESFDLLLAVCRMDNALIANGYKQLRELLERLCRTIMQNESLQMTDLSARISFVSAKIGLSVVEQNRLHTFRLTSNELLNHRAEPRRDYLLRDVKTLAFLIRKMYQVDIPHDLYELLPHADSTYVIAPPAYKRVRRMRVCFQSSDEQYLYVTPMDEIAEEPLKVRYNIKQINDEFEDTCRVLWKYAQLNLIDVDIDETGILTPSFIVLEPDYLIDISSLAECFRDYGHHPANYFFSRLQPIENARPLLLGNIANLFLDEWIHTDDELDYADCMRKAFQRYPIELVACADLRDKEKERQFFDDCKTHFEHIREVVNDTFLTSGYDLDKTDAVLEPSYICEALGLQGRLDYMQRDMSSLIEMKSGKADEYAIRGKVEPKENNKVQMLLYQAVLEYSMGMDHRKVRAYLLYTRYPLLYPSRPSWAMVRRAINLRNRIVADEYSVQLNNNPEYTATKIKEICSDVMNEKELNTRFWEVYLRPSIDHLGTKINALSSLEKLYFYSLYNFITKELYTSKSGDCAYEGRSGASSLWLSTLTEKCESGEILYDLRIKENCAANPHKSYLILSRGSSDDESVLPNFREGDAIVLYERNKATDNVTNQMIFKGNIEYLSEAEIKVRLRATQQNPAVLSSECLYAIEHDVMDTTFRAMYQGLYAFASTTQKRRDLLLSQRKPEFDETYHSLIEHATDDFSRVALKAQAANDFFLLVGPPGTGKTSCALKKMVESFHQMPGKQILLLSYTNRAVDEICKSLSSIEPAVDYIRIGSELSCEEFYRDHLIENTLSSCKRRSEVAQRIESCRIFVGTVAAISGRTELFRLKHFDVAIIDEATQILEPQLLGILCACGEDGRESIEKFILIGDHKQLPAVILQSEESSEISEEPLRQIGLKNLKDSLFERLYRTFPEASDMLCRQGRMHPDVASFANHAFYGDRLIAVGLPHQLENSDHIRRISFYPSIAEPVGASSKINQSEAKIVAELARKVYHHHLDEFNPLRTLGVIAPYRSQIALIKKEIEKLQIPELNMIMVDTVERFQGSERDIIIYSFCINYSYQIKQLSNLIEENGQLIDRKLNVALTRARKQMFITGVSELLKSNPIYEQLLNYIDDL